MDVQSLRNEIDQNPKLNLMLSIFLSLDRNMNKLNLTQKLIDRICESLVNSSSTTLFQLVQWFIQVFCIENVTGPILNYEDIEQKLRSELLWRHQKLYLNDQEAQTVFNQDKELGTQLGLEWLLNLMNHQHMRSHNFDYMATDTCKKVSSIDLMEYLSRDGESFNRLIKYKQMLFYAIWILNVKQKRVQYFKWLKEKKIEWLYLDLWRARVHFLLNEILYVPVNSCQRICMDGYTSFLTQIKSHVDKQNLSSLYVEYSGVLTFYYKYKKAEIYLQQAERLLGVKFELTGKMGVRTKYQEFKTAQLIAQAIFIKEDQVELQNELNSLPSVEQVLQQITPQVGISPEVCELDEDTILFETPKLDDETELKDVKSDKLSVHEQVLLLGVIENIHRTIVNDEVLQEQTEAYLNLMLDRSNNWLVFSKGLLLRSINEYPRFKRMERALAQMQTLVDQVNDPTPSGSHRYSLYFALHYPDTFSLNKLLAQHWMKSGGMQSGYEIFNRLEMWEECVECIVSQGLLQRAVTEIERFTAMGCSTLKMRCVLGEIRGDIKILKQVWKDSGKRFARAQRSLGEYYFFKAHNYAKSAKAYEKALAINSYNAGNWFIVGCSYMRMNKLDEAVRSFGQCVTVDESNSEAWANLAGCLQQKGQLMNAMAMLEQAVKYNENDWRIWVNLMNLSLKNKKFNRFYLCIEKLVQLRHQDVIDALILKKVNQSFQYQLQTYPQGMRRQVGLTRNRLNRLYQFLGKEMGQNPDVWAYYADICELFLIHEEQLIEIEKQMNQEQQLLEIEQQMNQILQEEQKQTLEKKVQFQEEPKEKQNKIYQLNNQIAELRLNACQTAMVVGWESDVKACTQVHELLKSLVDAYKYVDSLEDQTNLKLLLQSVVPKLEKTLDIQIQL